MLNPILQVGSSKPLTYSPGVPLDALTYDLQSKTVQCAMISWKEDSAQRVCLTLVFSTYALEHITPQLCASIEYFRRVHTCVCEPITNDYVMNDWRALKIIGHPYSRDTDMSKLITAHNWYTTTTTVQCS